MKRPLKVYYCLDCQCRMPQYYPKNAPFRDEHWYFCYRCKGKHLIHQTETWDYKREHHASRIKTPEQMVIFRNTAQLWDDYLKEIKQNLRTNRDESGISDEETEDLDCLFRFG